jgi:hypothetical protein
MARLQQKKQAAVTTGLAGSPAFPAQWFTAYTRSPRRPGLLAAVASGIITRQLDTSVGVPGPRDFAVRAGITRQLMPSRPSHPAPNTRDDREASLLWARDGVKHTLDSVF